MSLGIIGMARSGRAAAELALMQGHQVYISDAGDSPELRRTAQALQAQGARVQVGGHDIDLLAACTVIVLSPGVPPDIPVLKDPRVKQVRRVSEIEFAFWYLNSPLVAVTGTNGKSTTTALTAHVMRRAGLDVPAAGNIGIALSEIAMRDAQPDWVVVEASSFQLADIVEFAPRIGVLTNLSPDHLDRYPSVDAYYADKKNLFKNANQYSVWVLNGEDEEVLKLAANTPGRRFIFRTNSALRKNEVGAFLSENGALVLRLGGVDTDLAHTRDLTLLGSHNVANALAASIAAAAAEIPLEAIHDGLISFKGLPHRLETVREFGGVCWINDSKATNVASTRVALESMTRPTIVLLGGRHKGEPYTSLIDPMRERVRKVIAYGEAAAEIEQDLSAEVPVERVTGDFKAVVERAAEMAEPGDVVLLSPACASYDMFDNYEQRGERFKQLVANIEKELAPNG